MGVLGKLIVPSKTVDIEYPGIDGFTLKLAYLTRDEILKIRKKCTTSTFNKKTREPEEKVDNDLFQDLWIKAVVKGWSGLKMKHLKRLLPVEEIPEEQLEEAIPYTHEDAVDLLKNSPDIDGFITDMLSDVENFTQSN